MQNLNDSLRHDLLNFAYEVHRRVVRSESGQVTGATFVSEVRKRTGAPQADLAANLDYLVGAGHIEHILQPLVRNGVVTPGMNRHYYRITAKGIDAMEHPSQYAPKPEAPSISISNQNGVTIVGNHNVVSIGSPDLTSLLTELKALVQASNAIAPTTKTDVVADIETIEAQIQKQKPNRDILAAAWKGIESIVTVAEFGAIVAKISEFLGSLM